MHLLCHVERVVYDRGQGTRRESGLDLQLIFAPQVGVQTT